MRIQSYLFLTAIMIASIASSQPTGQHRLFLKTSSFIPAPVSADQLSYFNSNAFRVAGQTFAILQFKSIPTSEDRKMLEQNGITLLDYIPSMAYTAGISKTITAELLNKLNIRAILPVSSSLKIDDELAIASRTSHGEMNVVLSFFRSIPYDTVSNYLTSNGFSIVETDAKNYQVITVRVPSGRLQQLAELPFVVHIDHVPPVPELLNYNSRNSSRGNILQSNLPGGYNLTGEGIVIGIAEPATDAPQSHIDFFDRVIGGPVNGANGHSTHVFGIVAGAGNLNERFKGHAPRAKIISSTSSFSVSQIPLLVADSSMVLTNNSYATGAICSGTYSGFIYDKQAIDFPKLLNVYAAGNSGVSACGDYPPGFNTVHGGGNSAKNTLSVGYTYYTGDLISESSKGPGYGGRIKPDITATGANVVSTVPDNRYGSFWGSSMSSPAVVGGLALLNQRYRQLYNGQIPDAGLMKALICNGATDLGNRGPDYSYGFGWMNLLRSVRSLDQNWYFFDSVTHQAVKTHAIVVPAGAVQLKVMLYWPDAPGSPLAARPLVQDLDLKVTSPQNITTLPYVLDTVRANAKLPATRAEDHINNAEQVVVEHPAPGTYTLTVHGTEIGQYPQQRYSIVYDIIMDKAELTFPFGGECVNPGEAIVIRWDDWQDNTSSYTLEFSPDNGINWQLIDNAVSATVRQIEWAVPAITTAAARIQIKRNDNTSSSKSLPFVIAGVPQLSLAATQCPGYIKMEWTSVPGADDYEVFLLRKGEMQPVAITGDTTYTLAGLSEDTVYWISVRARINGKPGGRATAISRKPDNGSCDGNISDGDLELAGILSPVSGRKFTSTSLGNNEQLKIRIRNLDDISTAAFTVKYSINNGNWVAENISNAIPASGFYEHTFTGGINLSATGNYAIKVAVSATTDNNPLNDTLTVLIKNIDNPVINLSVPFIDSFGQAAHRKYSVSWTGLEGADRYDYSKDSNSARLTFGPVIFPTNILPKGMKLDTESPNGSTGGHRLTGTYNLSLYDTSVNDIGLSINYLSTALNGKIFIRGHDTLPWIPVFESISTIGSYLRTPVINLGRALRNAGQNYSAATQISVHQLSNFSVFSVSEIRLINANNDFELFSIDSLKFINCNLGSAVPVYVKLIYHGKQAVTNARIKYSINGGQVTEEVIPLMLPDSILNYRFSRLADLSAPGTYTIRVWTDNPGDDYIINNDKQLVVNNQPSITAFPYLEDFDKGNGNWITGGNNSSWSYGSPATVKIHDAASGSGAWKTNLSGNYNSSENSFLYSPCFNLSSLRAPFVSFSIATDIDFCYSPLCDYLQLQYTTNDITWNILFGSDAYNWATMWGADNKGIWKLATSALPKVPWIRFRFSFRSNNHINLEGAAIDNFHIYDSIGHIYKGMTLTNPVVQTINGGNDWIGFLKDGKMIAAINPYNQDLGLTKATVFTREGTARNFHGQYYLNRNFLISSAKKTADSIGVRLYFRDIEVDSLLASKNCIACTRPSNAYRFGVSAYHTDHASEYNNDLLDNIKGSWNFTGSSRIRIVPFSDGYYAEFKVRDLAEFWLNNGGLDNQSYLPVRFIQFSAEKQSSSAASLQWTTATEINIHHFEIEVAKGNLAFEQGTFTKVGETLSQGRSAQQQGYTFTDATENKSGIYYYRLKAVDENGNYAWSQVIPVLWSDELQWQVYPNPSSTGEFNLLYQAADKETVQLSIFNSAGALIKRQEVRGNGFIQRAAVKLEQPFPAGLYLLKVQTERQIFSLKMIKR